MSEQVPHVTVVVPVYDGVDELRGCLAALQAQDHPADRFDVVVVDNASTEDVAAAVPADERFTLLVEPRRGSYAARNTGLGIARGEVLAFTDADCRPDPDWLTEAVAELRREPAADMVGGAVRLVFRGGAPRTAAELYESVHGFPQARYLADQHFAVTANMVTWRRTVDRVGPFDASLMSRGDAQWGQRVAAAGGVQRYAERAVVRHPARASWGELLTKIVRIARGRIAADRAAGRGRRHLLGVAAYQLRSVVDGARGVRRLPGLTGPSARLRYLGALAVCRSVTAALLVRAAMTPPAYGR